MLYYQKEESTATSRDHCFEREDIKLYPSHSVHSVFEFLNEIRRYLGHVITIDIYGVWAYLIIFICPLDSRVIFILSP